MLNRSVLNIFVIITLLKVAAIIANRSFSDSTPSKKLSISGSVIDIKDVPYHVSLRYFGVHRCSGTLIDKNWILTAAHCECPHSVYIGSSNNLNGGINVDVIGFYEHSLYDSLTFDYDFSLLRIANYNYTNLTIGYAKLPKQNELIPDGIMLRVTGWGITICPSEDRNLLHAIKIPKVNEKDCKNNYEEMITERMFCAGYKINFAEFCQSDSGGPITLNNKIVGIASWREISGKSYAYSVYSKVSYVRDWIQKIAGI